MLWVVQLAEALACDSVKYIEREESSGTKSPEWKMEDRRQSPEEDLLRAERKLASQLGEA